MMYVHGMRNTRLYQIWLAMRQRCSNPNHIVYRYYGGRGIKVCDSWDNNFIQFYDWAMANGYSEELEIDRVNNTGDYSPNNCRWTTRTENLNNMRNNLLVDVDGHTYTISQLARKIGMHYNTLRSRYLNGDRNDWLIRPKHTRR